MSVEHMLPDTSIDRMMVVWLLGTATTTTGRARPMTSTAAPAQNRANGTCRRHGRRPGAASRISARLEYRAATGLRLRWLQAYSRTSAGSARRTASSPIHRNVIDQLPGDFGGRGRCARTGRARHGRRPVRASDSAPPAMSRIRPAAATSAVISSGSLRTTSCRASSS